MVSRLVIDCGGGTTDLTSGRFRIENNRVSYIIDLETRYENGDTNLGGNNLTYRILQLLKLRLTEELGFQTKEALFIGGAEEGKSAYEELERRYLQAEKWLLPGLRSSEAGAGSSISTSRIITTTFLNWQNR